MRLFKEFLWKKLCDPSEEIFLSKIKLLETKIKEILGLVLGLKWQKLGRVKKFWLFFFEHERYQKFIQPIDNFKTLEKLMIDKIAEFFFDIEVLNHNFSIQSKSTLF